MSEWISVKERLPSDYSEFNNSNEIEVWCDAWCGSDNVRYTYLRFFKGKFCDQVLDSDRETNYDFSRLSYAQPELFYELENITHWMPLPEPPNKG